LNLPLNLLVLNGMDNKKAGLYGITQKIINGLEELAVLKTINLGDTDIAPCLGCFGCWLKTPGICVINDYGREIAKEFINSDLIIFLTPVTFGGFSSILKKVVDRLIPNVLPHFQKIDGEIHHKPRYDKHPVIVAVGLLEEDDRKSREIFSSLLKRISINMFSPKHRAFFLSQNRSAEELSEDINNICAEVGEMNA